MASIDRAIALAEELKKKKKNPNYQVNQNVINSLDLANSLRTGEKDALKNYLSNNDDNFAPIRSTITEQDKERSWFKKGAFEDGYDFGDITKTVVGSASDLYKNATKGILNIGETTIDTGAYIAGGVGKIFGNDKFADKMEGFIEKDLINEDEIANRMTNTGTPIGWVNNLLNGEFSSLNPFDMEATGKGEAINKNSVFGDKSDSLAQSGGQLAATFGLQAIGVPWWLTTGVTSFGGEVESALKQDATYGEAGFSGLVNAGAEILTEKLSGGISFGGRTLDAGLKSQLTKGITNKTLNALTQFGIDVVGEGGEELLTEVISNIGRKLSYEDEKTWGEILASEEAVNNYIEAFIGGAVLGGGFNVGRLSSSIQSGRNYDTGLTQNEQSIVDKEVESRKAELEQDGTKLNKKQITEIENQVRNDLEKGYISTDTIESTLGGETYNTLKSTRDTKTNLENQIAELESKPNAEITVKEMEQLQSLREQLKSVDTNTLENNLRSEIGQKIKSDAYLQRSYQEKANRSVKFEADLSKYDAKQQEVVQKAIDSGVLNNTNRTHDFVDMVAKISADKGISFDFTNNTKLKESGFAVEGKTVNGYIKDGSIAVNIDSSKALNRVVGHEITHILEGTELYTELQNVVKQYATTKGEYDSRLADLTKLYKDVKGANVENELTADLVGDYLFTDTDFINNLSVEKPSLFKKVYDEIKHLYNMATAGSKEARELLKVKKAFEKAYRENVKGTNETSEVRDSLSEVTNNIDSLGRELTTEQTDFFKDSKVVDADGNLLVMYHGTRADFNTFDMNKSGQNYEGDWSAFGRGFYFTPNQEAANDFSSAAIEGNSKNVKEVYLNITKPFYTETNYSETLSNLKEKYNIDDTTLNKGYRLIEFLNQNGYDSTKVLQELGYDGVIDSYNGKIEEAVAFKPNQIKNTDNTKPTLSEDIRYSLSSETDNKGRELTNAQVEKFKDSKVRDDEGRLLEVYHGTKTKGINIFNYDPNRQTGVDFGKAYYFTSDYIKAKGYQYDADSDPRVKEHQDQERAARKKMVDAGFTAESRAEYKEWLDTHNIMDIIEDEAYIVKHADEIGGETKKVYLNLTNPLMVDAEGKYYHKVYPEYFEQARENGNDGIIVKNVIDNPRGENRPIDVYIAFNENQIKNVDNLNPTNDPDIRYSLSEDIGIHYGDLGKARDTNYFAMSNTRRSTGHFGTGTYFVGSKESNVGTMKDSRPTHEVNFSDYYLFKPKTSTKAEQLHNLLRDINNKELNAFKLEDAGKLFNKSYEELYEAYKKTTTTAEEYNNLDDFDLLTKDSLSTVFMKELGYNGIDVRDIEGFDNGTYGSVIYDLEAKNNNLSLSNPNEQIAPSRNDVFGRDIRLEIAPLQEEVKALTETVTELRNVIDMGRNTTEADLPMLEQQNNEAFNTLTDEDIAPTIEDTTPESEPTTIESPLEAEGRDIDSVGNRKVKAYQYENPEVKPYFQAEARVMLNDLHNSVKGEKVWTEEFNPATGLFENAYVTGTKRVTTSDIAYLLDNYNYTYAEIEKGLNAIIEDDGKENIAVAKRIEFMLDERLREGYTSIDGTHIPANQSYINLLQGMEQTKQYSEAPLGETSVEEVAPIVEKASNTQITEEIAPTRSETDWDSVEDTSKGKQLKYNEESQIIEEDLVKKTKKELRKALLGTEAQKEFIMSALDNAKNRSMALMNNTDTIRNTELVFGREAGRVINEAIFQKEIDNEADSIKWQNQEREDIKKLGIKARSKESAAVQKYGEKQYVNEHDVLVPYGDAELASEFPDVATQERIKNAAKEIRNKYDNYIERANGVITKLGFDPIPKRNDYMRHFQELNDVFSKFGLPFNAKNMQEHTLPTDINGLTEYWSPNKNYFANIQPRKGIKTEYDAITGIDGYIGGIANLIYHTEDIQRGRAFEELIRETYGEDKGWENLDNLPDELKQARAEKIQDNHMSNYVAWVHEWTNNVAGKKNKIDRSIEAVFGRKAFSFLDETRKQVGANMIGFNLSSSLTNLIAPVQAMAKTNKLAVVKGTADTIKNIFVKDNFMNNNRFLTSRMGTDMLSRNAWQKMRDAGYVFMKGMDWFSSNQIVRSKYYELRAKGMSETQAHAEAGKFAARIMGDRTKGANAQIYNSKLLGLVTQFQLEVNNQLYSQFYDTYHESKEAAKGNALKTAAGMTFTLGQLFAFTHLFGQTFQAIAGYNPTFDIVEILKTALGWGDDEDEEKTTSERLKKAADQLVDALPYVNILTGGGRIPVASGIPNLVGVATGGKDQYGNELTLEDEMKKLLYLIPPTGGNQIKKTTQGLSMFDEDLPVSGSYTDSGNLRFPVEDTPLNKLQAGLFGQWSNKNAREYFDNERQPLKEKQIEEYVDLDLPIADYWEYRDGLKKQKTLEEKFEYINGLDVTTEQKNIMINNVVDRKEEVDMSNYDDFGSYEEFDFAIKNEEKYNFLQENNIAYEEYNASEESREAYNWAFNNPESYVVSKAITNDVITYRKYASDLYDLKADKDSSGKSISGSRKEKVIDYVNNLDIDYEARLILYKMEYTSDDSANYDIINYLNERDDITYDEMVTILTKLDMTVDKDGIIRW